MVLKYLGVTLGIFLTLIGILTAVATVLGSAAQMSAAASDSEETDITKTAIGFVTIGAFEVSAGIALLITIL